VAISATVTRQIARSASMMSVLSVIVNLIRGPKENDDDEKWVELHFKIRSIQARIERLRSNLDSPQRRIERINDEVEKVSSIGKTQPHQTEQQIRNKQRNAELDDIKRKLTGGKK